MKLTACILLACLMFLISFQGNADVKQSMAIADCCKGDSCGHGKHQQQDKGCDSKACNRMVSCSRCGFIVSEYLVLQEQFSPTIDKALPLESIGILVGYPQTGWHPPKA